jgi:dTDP-4-amino-4,6-dideoxygalactose transaminase
MELVRLETNAGVALVEDMAQAQGARRFGTRAGTLGDVAATSFYPGKNLGAYGDAGAVMTNSAAIADQLRKLRNHGGIHRYDHSDIGFNSRMDSLQAVVLSAKLSLLDQWNQQRVEAAELYAALLEDLNDVVLPATLPGNEHVFHLYVIRVPGRDRDRIVARLNASGVGAGVHYPLPVHLLPAYKFLDHPRGSFPEAEKLSQQILSLPLYPGITAAQQEFVAQQLRSSLEK